MQHSEAQWMNSDQYNPFCLWFLPYGDLTVSFFASFVLIHNQTHWITNPSRRFVYLNWCKVLNAFFSLFIFCSIWFFCFSLRVYLIKISNGVHISGRDISDYIQFSPQAKVCSCISWFTKARFLCVTFPEMFTALNK